MTTSPTAPPEPANLLYGSGGQLRAVWRIGVVSCVYFLVNGILQSVLTVPITFVSSNTGNLLSAREWVDFLAAFATVAFVLFQVDRQQWSHIGMHGPAWKPAQLGRGVALGGVAIVLTAGTLFVAGQLQFESDPLSSLLGGDGISRSANAEWMLSTVRITLLLAPAAFFEELVFRGYLWRVAEDSGNTRVALIVTSVLFGLAHVQNPGVNQLAILNVVLAGGALGLVRLYTNSLPAAWTAHLVWNWIMAAALHVPVSGLPIATPGYRTVLTGPEWFAGGEWGPEGGLAATIVLLGAIALGLSATMFNRTQTKHPEQAGRATGVRSL
ncbi:MAG: CPBP family intramembrane metalloprotease [Phycisphaerae bacterium]|nr:CPBP family intramembrane metalloprotease [Gemmatimonadaceae bacterium]